MNKIRFVVLEVKEGVYEGSAYSNVIARYGGRLLKFKLDSKKIVDPVQYLDKNCEAEYEIVAGANMLASLKVTSLVEVLKVN